MTIVVLLAAVIRLWSLETEVERWRGCWMNLENDLALCATANPDAESLERRLCEAEARGRYFGCLDAGK